MNESSKLSLIQLALKMAGQPTLRRRKPAPPVILLMALRSHEAEVQSPQRRLLLQVSVAPSESQPVRIRQLGT